MKREVETDDNILLTAVDISKKYCRNFKRSLLYAVVDIFEEVFGYRRGTNKLRLGEFWAVNKVNFNLRRGESIGLVGANGSGKTTLLRMISGLIKPDSGEISIYGRVVPLIALGAGFSPALTGRENIITNLSILGMSRLEIKEVIQDVIDFSEIPIEALDAPIQTYSSGMAARLGFSCAIHAKADLLLIDEVLSVGDMKFRAKCYRRLAELKMAGVSFILVSHNTNSIISVCDRAIYLSKGCVAAEGLPTNVLARFEEDLFADSSNNDFVNLSETLNKSEQLVIIQQVLLFGPSGPVDYLSTGHFGSFSISVDSKERYVGVNFSVLIRELFGENELVLHLNSNKDDFTYELTPGNQELKLIFPICSLRPGLYTAKIYLHADNFYMLDAVESFVFKVVANKEIDMCQNKFYQNVEWL
jgi:lipopolysaccharide transport system ATP-binding protein